MLSSLAHGHKNASIQQKVGNQTQLQILELVDSRCLIPKYDIEDKGILISPLSLLTCFDKHRPKSLVEVCLLLSVSLLWAMGIGLRPIGPIKLRESLLVANAQPKRRNMGPHFSHEAKFNGMQPEALKSPVEKNQKSNFLFLPSCCSGGVKHEICHLELLQKSTTCKKERKKNFLKIFFYSPSFFFWSGYESNHARPTSELQTSGCHLLPPKQKEKNLRKVKFCWMRKKGRERGRKKKQQLQLL